MMTQFGICEFVSEDFCYLETYTLYTQNALKKLKSTLGAIQINNFMKNAKDTITKIVML